MPLNKGIVMESGEKWTVVLTPHGEFVKIPAHPHHLEGREVFFHPAAVGATSVKKSRIPKWARGLSAAVACLLLLITVFPFGGGTSAYAAVTIDINPSIELEVDRDTLVINASSLNEEGQEILQAFDWKNKRLTVVTVQIVEIAEQKGYMNAENRVLITTTYYEEENETKKTIEPLLEEVTESVSTENEVTFVIVEGKKEWQEEAKEKKVPPGAYMLVKQAEEQGIQLTGEEVKSGELDQLLPVTGVKVIPVKAKKEKDNKRDKDKEEKEEDKDKGKMIEKPSSGQKSDIPDSTSPQAPVLEKKKEKEEKEEREKDQDRSEQKRQDAEKKQEKKEQSNQDQEKEAPGKVPPKVQEENKIPNNGKNKESDDRDDDDRKAKDRDSEKETNHSWNQDRGKKEDND
ncbi:hypothetical protein [Ammoniphilus sp. 3BR4]|uniref:anti-sigma-I factor RsgI family protein n=1 Tax=Ammoniphilus sp. 3BR4 TaxID=3158265 RepID=UPI00346551F7